MKPKVSVIVPTYNRQNTLKQTIDSILAQSFQEFEIIVIDDGSTDNTKDLIATYTDKRIHYFYQENQGLPSSWNLGIKKSGAEYLAFLDSDDIWLKDKLQTQISFIENSPLHQMGCTTAYFLHTINNKYKTIIPRTQNTTLRSILWKNILHIGTTLLCKRTVFDDIGEFDTNLRRGQDTDWLIRYRKKFQIGVIQHPLAVFNQHLSRSAEIMEQSHLFFLEKHKNILQEQGTLFHKRKKALVYTDLAYLFYRAGNLIKAKDYTKKSIQTFPITWLGLYLIWLDVHFGTQLKKNLDAMKYPTVFK